MITEQKLRDMGYELIEQYFRYIADLVSSKKNMPLIYGLIDELSANQKQIFIMWAKYDIAEHELRDEVILIINRCK